VPRNRSISPVVRAILFGCALAMLTTPLGAQTTDDRVDAIAAIIRHALDDSRFADTPRSRILLDTVWTARELPDHDAVVAGLVRELGLRAGVSRDHCRRTAYDPDRLVVGEEVHGVAAILVAGVDSATTDSVPAWVTIFHGTGPYQPGGRGLTAHRTADGWRVEGSVFASHGMCDPVLFTAPIVASARTLLTEIDARDPICLDAIGHPLFERDQIVGQLGAEVRGRWLPPIRDIGIPEEYRHPCAKADTDWGAILAIPWVDWSEPGWLRVTIEAEAANGAWRRDRFTLRETDGEWVVVDRIGIGTVH
jgi:hypothetical protein